RSQGSHSHVISIRNVLPMPTSAPFRRGRRTPSTSRLRRECHQSRCPCDSAIAACQASASISETWRLRVGLVAARLPRKSPCTPSAAVPRTRSTVSIGPFGLSCRAIPASLPATRISSEELRHHAGGVDHPIGEAPFVVVPRDDARELAFEHRGFEAIDGGTRRIVIEVAADERLI